MATTKNITSEQKYEVAIVGGGPGGYVAAIKLAQLGKKVVCIDNGDFIGGTCLNVGCIPSKTLLNSTHKYYDLQNHFADHGITVDGAKLSIEKMMENKRKVISELGNGIKGLFAKNKITYIKGFGSFENNNTLLVKKDSVDNITKNSKNDSNNKNNIDENNTDEFIKIIADNIIIATGSNAATLNNVSIDEKAILSSTGALNLSSAPKNMVVIGAGVIGLEMSSVWSRLGSKITVIEYSDRIMSSSMDVDVAKEIQKIMEKQGLNFVLNAQVSSVNYKENNGKNTNNDKNNNTLIVEYLNRTSNEKTLLECDAVLIAIGRKANTNGLNLDKIGVQTDKHGQIIINKNFATNVNGIHAIGDVVGGPMLAHKASEEGVAVAEIIVGHYPYINYETIPNVIYTYPEIATVGKTENQLKTSGIEYKIGKFPLLANSRSKANRETDGFVKIIQCTKTETILGATIIAPCAGEMIHELVVAMEFKATAEDIACISHSHPSISEAVKEAAMAAAYGKSIHL